MSQDYHEIFIFFRKYMEREEYIRDTLRNIVKEIEHASRDIIMTLQGVHKCNGIENIPRICGSARGKFGDVRKLFSKLRENVPEDEFYRYHEHWKYAIQRLVFSTALILFLEKEVLIERQESSDFLGISCDPKDPFHIELDDFLLGILLMADELSRLSVNCATYGNYTYPVKIAEFVSDIHSGFRLLNLKNDSFRKKFDTLKYNLKKVEEVVYDLSIRKLIPKDNSGN